MTQTARRARSSVGRHVAPAPTRRRRRTLRWLALALVVLAIGFGVWLATGLLDASRTVQAQAAEAQASLQHFRDSLKLGDREQAAQHLSRGKASLASAETSAQRRQVRIASGLPYLGSTVADLDHLLAAARIMTTSATDALDVYRDFAGEDSKLFKNSQFSLPAIHSAQASVADIATAMDRAETELNAVTGKGPKGGQALEKKQSALAQVNALRAELVTLGPVLEGLPAAVGEGKPKTYLVTVLNPAELRASGGAPLSVAFIRFTKGKMTTPLKGQTSVLTNGNQRYRWEAVEGNPWTASRARFGNANFNPDFPVSAEEMLRAAVPHFGIHADGVIALDVVAISHLLQATGPIKSAVYGTLTPENVAQKLVVDAYNKTAAQVDQDARHDENDELMTVMLSRMTEGGGMIGKVRALGGAVPGRHLQLYFRDNALQDLVHQQKSAGEVPAPETGDLAAVYTQNGNGSKADVFQHRTVRETITLRADGSARVRRTVVIENRTPPYVGPGVDERLGYFTRWSTSLVMNLLPPGARVISSPARVSSPLQGIDQDGRPFAQGIVTIPPGKTVERTWVYDVPRAAVRDGNGLRLLVYAETQGILVTPTFELTVVPPKGWTAKPGPGGWQATDVGAAITVTMDRARLLQLKVSPS